MKITGIETLLTNHPLIPHAGRNRWMWVRLYTDEGLVGLGETFPDGYPEAALIHGTLSRILLGRSPLDIEALWWDMFSTVEYYGWAGAELRALSAIDIALWDIAGRYRGLPLYQILGGRVREIPVYNTCYDPQFDMMTQAGDLAEYLLEQDIRMMKVWPFDRFAVAHKGQYISREDLQCGLEPIKQIRDRVGSQIQIALEGHGYWNLLAAERIARTAEPYEIFWMEDMLPLRNLNDYKELARITSIPICLSERLMTKWQYLPVLQSRLAQIIMVDIAWTGGISEARKICAAAEAEGLPITFHNCGGPVLCGATAHLAAVTHNLLNVETVRPYFERYAAVAKGHPEVKRGFLEVPDGPGLGIELLAELSQQHDVIVQRSGDVCVPTTPN